MERGRGRERNGGVDGERQTGWGRRNRETAGEEGQTMAQHRFTTNTETFLFHKPAEAESQRSDATHNLTLLSEYYLLLGFCWSITHLLYSLPLQQVPCVALWWSLCWSQFPALCGPRSCETGAKRHAGKPVDVDQRVLVMTDGCALLVCIYAFKLPSAVHNPNDKRWNKREPEHFHLRGPLPQPSAGAWTQTCTSEALMLTDSAPASRIVFWGSFFFLSWRRVQSLRVMMLWMLQDHCMIMRW